MKQKTPIDWRQYSMIFQTPISVDMDDYIKRATWDMRKREGRKVSLAEYARSRILSTNWRTKLMKWRKAQTDFDPTQFAGRKKTNGK